MILDDIQEIVNDAKCPESFPSNLNIGNCSIAYEFSQKLFQFYPSDSCDVFADLRKYYDDAYVCIHSHGISVSIGGKKVQIHNSQIIVFDYWHFDDTYEYKKSDTRTARVLMGSMLAGPLGAAVGLATSFGKGKKYEKNDNLVIAYWDIYTRTQQIINLTERKDSKPGSVGQFVDYWKKQVQINNESGREPMGHNIAGVSSSSSCLILLLTFLTPSLYGIYKILSTLLC